MKKMWQDLYICSRQSKEETYSFTKTSPTVKTVKAKTKYEARSTINKTVGVNSRAEREVFVSMKDIAISMHVKIDDFKTSWTGS